MGRKVRVSEAGRILGLSPQTIRNWTNDGRLKCSYSLAGQRVYDVDYLQSLIEPERGKPYIFYVRSSTKNDVLTETQVEKLTSAYGDPFRVFKDSASGLNENRKGLRALLAHCKENPSVVCVTNKDRLSRFGFSYLEMLLNEYGCEVSVLDSDDTKEPHAVLLQDFMTLLASFSGKFYRLRGWEQQRQFLSDVEQELSACEK